MTRCILPVVLFCLAAAMPVLGQTGLELGALCSDMEATWRSSRTPEQMDSWSSAIQLLLRGGAKKLSENLRKRPQCMELVLRFLGEREMVEGLGFLMSNVLWSAESPLVDLKVLWKSDARISAYFPAVSSLIVILPKVRDKSDLIGELFFASDLPKLQAMIHVLKKANADHGLDEILELLRLQLRNLLEGLG